MELLSMEEILQHLFSMKSYATWDVLNINWCTISSINSTLPETNVAPENRPPQ